MPTLSLAVGMTRDLKGHNFVAEAWHLPDLLQDHAPHLSGTYDEKTVAPQTSPAEPVARQNQDRATGRNKDHGQ